MSVKRTCYECHHIFDAFWGYEVCCQACVNGRYSVRVPVPTTAEWAAGHTKSVAEQVKRRPLSDRLIDVAALCFLSGLAMVGWVKRRVRW